MNILVAGDYCPQNRVEELFEKGDFATVLGEVKPIIEKADYSIVNFECAISSGGEKPIEKIGSNLQCSKRGVEPVKWAGFDCVTLANNHFYDFGDDGVKKTLEACDEYGIDTVGGGVTLQEASGILYKDIAGQTLAIINCCEHEFSIATENSGGSNPLNPIQQFYAIKEAREKAHYVLVIVHGGNEHFQLPSPRMVDTYRFFVDAGADAVVNHHQHCFSGFEIYNDKPIFYGLGNFCFDGKNGRGKKWNYGYMVSFSFEQNRISFEIIPYNQCDKNPVIALLPKDEYNNELARLNGIITDRSILLNNINHYYSQKYVYYCQIFEPIFSRFFLAAKLKHILPSFISNNKKLSAKNIIFCESHLDLLMWWLGHDDVI